MRGPRVQSGRLLSAALVVLVAVGGAGSEPPDCSPAPVECFGEGCVCEGGVGDVVITEVMARTIEGTACPEWFEIYNGGAVDLDLEGWELEDPVGGGRWVVPETRVDFRAGDVWILSSWLSYIDCPLYSFRPELEYPVGGVLGEFSLGLYEGGLVLRDPSGRVRDAVVWDRSWGLEPGRSLELVDVDADNAVRANWAPATALYAYDIPYDGTLPMYGTPRALPSAGRRAESEGPCDDANPCTADFCLAPGRCSHVLSDEPCDDGDACTGDDRCQWSLAGATCRGVGPGNCRDGCAEGQPCDDGDPCTTDDVCVAGRCRGALPPRAPTCDDPDRGVIAEGICIPELGGVAYAIASWWLDTEWVPELEWISCRSDDDCAGIAATCGDVVCHTPFRQCVILARSPAGG